MYGVVLHWNFIAFGLATWKFSFSQVGKVKGVCKNLFAIIVLASLLHVLDEFFSFRVAVLFLINALGAALMRKFKEFVSSKCVSIV